MLRFGLHTGLILTVLVDCWAQTGSSGGIMWACMSWGALAQDNWPLQVSVQGALGARVVPHKVRDGKNKMYEHVWLSSSDAGAEILMSLRGEDMLGRDFPKRTFSSTTVLLHQNMETSRKRLQLRAICACLVSLPLFFPNIFQIEPFQRAPKKVFFLLEYSSTAQSTRHAAPKKESKHFPFDIPGSRE